MIFRACFTRILFASCLLTSALALSQAPSGKDKDDALHQAVCTLPYGERIGLPDIPSRLVTWDWMARLPDGSPLSLLSIPATHDAGTALGVTGWTRCQVLTIPAQLGLGLRGFDIRLRQVNGVLGVYHGEESQQLSFQSVMQAFAGFLTAHPKEFIVMRVREESSAVNPTQPFEAAFARQTQTAQFGKLIYHASSRTEIPTVGQVRGKIVLLDNYGKLPDAIDYPNPTMSVQDDYDTSDMDKKVKEILAKFEEALGRKTGEIWDVNYTSSSTAQVDQLANAKAVNLKVRDYLSGKKGHLGLVLMNFPGVDAIRSIIDSNFP